MSNELECTILEIDDEEREETLRQVRRYEYSMQEQKEALRQLRHYEYLMQLDDEKDFGIRGDLL